MRTLLIPAALFALVPALASAEETRALGAHEHGSGVLNMAFDGGRIALELEAPGADIVGFEYAAESVDDRAAVDAAISDLARPLDLFVVPASAECTVTSAKVSVIGDEHHEDEHHEDEHDDEDHEGEDHADEAHDEHEDEAGHTEFHAEYMMDCAKPARIDRIEFAYFGRFPNAQELDVQIVSDTGAQAFEVERDNPVLDMRGMF